MNPNPRVEYEMSEDDYDKIIDACKPVVAIQVGGHSPRGPQENANAAWAILGKKMGFDSITARPSEKGPRFFTAVPSETMAQKAEREMRKREKELREELETLGVTQVQHAERISKIKEELGGIKQGGGK